MFNQVLLYGIVTGTQVLFLALALYVVHLVGRVINLALGGIATATAYTFYYSFSVLSLPVVVAGLITIAVASILGYINYKLNEPLTIRGQYLMAMLASFALGLMLESVVALFFGSGAVSILAGVLPVISFSSLQLPITGAAIILGGIIVAGVAVFLYKKTPLGRKLRAVSEKRLVAMSLGIHPGHLRLAAYILAAITAGTIGILVSLNTALTPMLGFQIIVMAFMALLVGGVSDLRGTIVASYLLVLIPELIIGSIPSISSSWRLTLVFCIAAVLLLIRPRGIFTKVERLS